MTIRKGHDVGRPAKTGRPRALTPKLQEKMVQLLEVGNYMETCCGVVGVSQSTVYDWLRRGGGYVDVYGDDPDKWPGMEQDDERVFAEFLQAVEAAAARAEAHAVATVRKHSDKHWQAAMTFLERRYPTRWRRRITVDDGQGIDASQRETEQRMLADPEAVDLMHDALRRAAASGGVEDAEVVEGDVS